MKTYRVFTCHDELPELVKQGFYWPAFFFSWLWALINGLYLYALLMFVADVFVPIFSSLIFTVIFSNIKDFDMRPFLLMIIIVVKIAWGFAANNWKASKLIKRGYVQNGTVDAPGTLAAINKLEATTQASSGERGLSECAPVERREQ
jgi:hypothetical protein